LLGGAALRDPALGQHGHEIAQPKGLIEVVRHLERRDSLALVQLPQLSAKHLPRCRVNRGKRLVEQENRGLGRQRTGQRHPLLLSAAESPNRPIQQGLDRQHTGELRYPVGRVGMRSGRARPPDTIGDVLADTEMRKEVILLVDEAEAAPLRRQVGDVIIMHEDAP
jgi:hypothetical protein